MNEAGIAEWGSLFFITVHFFIFNESVEGLIFASFREMSCLNGVVVKRYHIGNGF